jgi:hypothetical protein
LKRFVILRIDDIYRLLFDYAGEPLGLPADAKPTKFRLVQGKLQLMVESDSWEHDMPAEQVKFDLRRVYSV